jgi:excisionase family DNA binding protein
MPERISISVAADILGISGRTIRHMAQRGEIPGAAKIGRRWTFDQARLRDYVRRQEAATCQSARRHLPDVSGVATPYGVEFRSGGETSSGRYARTIQRLRDGVGKNTENKQ